MTGGLPEEAHAMFDCPHFFITCPKVKPPDTGKGNGPCAHGAGLEGHIEVAPAKSLGPQHPRAFADSDKLCMGGGILEFQRPVSRLRDDPSAWLHQDCAHRHLATGGRSLRLGESHLHWLWQFQLHSAT